jgi:hypothetical protein
MSDNGAAARAALTFGEFFQALDPPSTGPERDEYLSFGLLTVAAAIYELAEVVDRTGRAICDALWDGRA